MGAKMEINSKFHKLQNVRIVRQGDDHFGKVATVTDVLSNYENRIVYALHIQGDLGPDKYYFEIEVEAVTAELDPKLVFRILEKSSEHYGRECRMLEISKHADFAKVQVLWNTEPKAIIFVPIETLIPISR